MAINQIIQYLLPIGILVAFVALGYVIRFVLNVYLVRLAKRTKTEIDDIIIGAIRTPIIIILILIGLGTALPYVPFLPEWAASYTPIIFKVLIALVGIYCTIKILSGLTKYYGVVRPSLRTIMPTIDKVAKFLVAFIGLMVVLDTLGVSVTAPLAALGIGGIAIAFALQSTLSDFLSGIYIMADRPIRVGDYIKLESGQEGYVLDIGWRSTKIRELPNNVIVVPNSKLAGAIVTNYYLPKPEMSVIVEVGVSYDSDLSKVEKVTLDVAKKVLKKVAGGVETFEPFMRYHTFDDFSINFKVILRAKTYVDRFLLAHEFIKELHKRYKKEGIEIPFPIRTVYMKRGR
jgi:small-conductance mechanosensitive channel